MDILQAILASLPALATLVYTIVKDKRANHSALNRAVGFLLLRSIRHNATECIARGYITEEELAELEESYKLYHDDMGGNGYADTIMSQARKLPIVKGREV